MVEQLPLEMESPAPLRHLWERVIGLAESRVGREAVESWLRDAVPLSLESSTLTLGVPNGTARTWIEKKYSRALAEALEQIEGAPASVQVVVERVSGRARAEPRPTPAPPGRAASPFFSPLPLNEKYTFQNFVSGQANPFAHAAASAVAEKPGREYNPLFLYGGVGLGKTHLLQAIGHALLRRSPRARVVYVSGETFTSHFVTSLREHREEEFRRAYRGVDVWLVDDVQFLADKASTREEFFHTFNELYLTNRQIVLASDRPPRELRLQEDRLRTRLESGLMAEILPPELETRVAILERRAEQEGAEVTPEVLYQIARAVTSSVRLLEAALIRVIAHASLQRRAITPELAAEAMPLYAQEGDLPSIGLLQIQREVAARFSVPEHELVGPRRERQICLARQVAMYLSRELCRLSLAEIGRAFGGKAHSTVIHACEKLEREIRQDRELESCVRELRTRLSAGAGG